MRQVGLMIVLLSCILVAWLVTTNNPRVWPVRNTLQYKVLRPWWALTEMPQSGEVGWIVGFTHSPDQEPIPNVWVLLSRWDGSTYRTRSNEAGRYRIEGIPAGTYRPIGGRIGYQDELPGGWWGQVIVDPDAETVVDIELVPDEPRTVEVPTEVRLGAPQQLRCQSPLESTAQRRQVTFTRTDGHTNQLTYLYTPVTPTTPGPRPVLLTVYPGPVESWECVSVPLAEAGYAVFALGPAYNLELEKDIDELHQLLRLIQTDELPQIDGEQVALLAGSYSALMTQRLLQRQPGVQANVLLGPPTDLFDLRRRYEAGTFIPPFGLDQVLVALGLPDRAPLRYWRYSSAYHVNASWPPTILFHSRQDEVVPYQQSEFLAEQLERVGVPHELHLFDGATHYLLSGEAESLQIYEKVLAFLDEQLR